MAERRTPDPRETVTLSARLVQERQKALRWLLRLTGIGLLVPGLIHLLSWSDTVKASSFAFGEALAPLASAGAVVCLLGSGLSFILGRWIKPGALAASLFLVFGTYVHVAWARMLGARLDMMPEGLDATTQALWMDTTLFASNSQIPHVLKNLILLGVCWIFYREAEDLFPERELGRHP